MADEKTAAVAGTKRPTLPECTIEVATDKNATVVFGPTSQLLRGRWDSHNLNPGDGSSEARITALPIVPGMYLSVDMSRRTCRIVDPLSLPENQGLLQEINRHTKTMPGNLRKEVSAHLSVERKNCTDEEMATWMYWMMRMVNEGYAILKGTAAALPESEDEIHKLFPGAKIKKNFFNLTEEYARMMVREANAHIQALDASGI